MHQRDVVDTSVTDLFDLIAPTRTSHIVTTDMISVDLTGANVITIAPDDAPTVELPATGEGLLALGNWLDIPSKFLARIDPDVQDDLLNALLQRKATPANVQVANDEIVEVVGVNANHVDPRSVVETAVATLGEDAQVIEWRKDGTGYGFDVTVSDTSTVAVGGDLEVGDITRGGLRFGHDTKHNLAPWVQRYLFRLVCTNGMELPDPSLRVSSRGRSSEEIVDELGYISRHSLARLSGDIRAFYELRTHRVENPASTLVRLAEENGISDRILANLTRSLPEYAEADGSASMFDLINLITNYANSDSLTNRFNARRTLEMVGGEITYDHSARCPRCSNKL